MTEKRGDGPKFLGELEGERWREEEKEKESKREAVAVVPR